MSATIDEARRIASSLLGDLENNTSPAERVLMRAKRLARLMRDADAQTWLEHETRGYPPKFSFETLGTCEQYARHSGRINLETSQYYTASLPELRSDRPRR